MSLKDNKVIKMLEKNEKSIIEGIVLSLVSALALTAIITGSFKEVLNIQFVANTPLIKVLAIFILSAAIVGIIYHSKQTIAKLIMFGLVMIYFLMMAYATHEVSFESVTNNGIGQACLLALSGGLAVIAFLYVKDEIFDAQSKITVSDKSLKFYTLGIGLFLLIITSVIGVYKYLSYTAPTFDFGIFAQGFEYMKQTGQFKTVVERGHELSHFAVHCSPIFYVALPIYFIAPRAETVAIIQSIMVALPVLPIYLLGKQFKLTNKTTVAIMAIYALFPATVGGILYDIHENCFLTFMILMLVWAVEKKKNILMAVFLILTLFVKEDAAMYVIILGVFWIASRKSKARGLIMIIAGAIYFVIALKIISSFGYGIMDFRYSNMFYDSQGGFIQMARVLITNPGYVLSQIIANENASNMDKIAYIMEIFIPVGALIFTTGKKYSRYILLGSIVVVSLITTYVYQHDIGFQYNFGHIALIIYLIIMNVADMKREKSKKLLVCSAIICAIMFMGLIAPRVPRYVNLYRQDSETIKELNKAVEMVPNDKSVFTSGWITGHMSKNLQCYDTRYLDDKHKEGVPEYPDYLLVDERESDAATYFGKYIHSGKYDVLYEGKGNGNSKIVTVYINKKTKGSE